MLSKRFFALVAAIALQLSVVSTVYAEPATICAKPKIFFVNGVWNDEPADVEGAARALAVALREEVDLSGSKYELQPFWNPGDGVIVDVLEVFLNQRTAGASYLDGLFLAYLAFGKTLATRPTNFRTYVDELSLRVASQLERSPVVLVAHSQGNILVNEVARQLMRDPVLAKRLSVVGVAVADDMKVDTNYKYITHNNDLIINNLPGALDANFSVALIRPLFPVDFTFHKFIETYLSDWGSAVSGQGTLRNRVATLTKEAFDLVRCVETELQLISPKPPVVKIGSSQEFVVQVVPLDNPTAAGRSPAGTVRIIGPGGKTLCEAQVNVAGMARCNVTFEGEPRTENVQLRFSGTDGYIDSSLNQSVALITGNSATIAEPIGPWTYTIVRTSNCGDGPNEQSTGVGPRALLYSYTGLPAGLVKDGDAWIPAAISGKTTVLPGSSFSPPYPDPDYRISLSPGGILSINYDFAYSYSASDGSPADVQQTISIKQSIFETVDLNTGAWSYQQLDESTVVWTSALDAGIGCQSGRGGTLTNVNQSGYSGVRQILLN